MVRECNVLLNNDVVTVVDFDGVHIQFPSVKKNVKTVNVEYRNGNYKITDKCIDAEIAEAEPVKEKPARKTHRKKPTEEE